jgi:hypothetical protein
LESIEEASEYLCRFVAERWGSNLDYIQIECDVSLEELRAMGRETQGEGVRRCKRLFKAPVLNDEIGYNLWKKLHDERGRAGEGGVGSGGSGDDDVHPLPNEGERRDPAPKSSVNNEVAPGDAPHELGQLLPRLTSPPRRPTFPIRFGAASRRHREGGSVARGTQCTSETKESRLSTWSDAAADSQLGPLPEACSDCGSMARPLVFPARRPSADDNAGGAPASWVLVCADCGCRLTGASAATETMRNATARPRPSPCRWTSAASARAVVVRTLGAVGGTLAHGIGGSPGKPRQPQRRDDPPGGALV